MSPDPARGLQHTSRCHGVGDRPLEALAVTWIDHLLGEGRQAERTLVGRATEDLVHPVVVPVGRVRGDVPFEHPETGGRHCDLEPLFRRRLPSRPGLFGFEGRHRPNVPPEGWPDGDDRRRDIGARAASGERSSARSPPIESPDVLRPVHGEPTSEARRVRGPGAPVVDRPQGGVTTGEFGACSGRSTRQAETDRGGCDPPDPEPPPHITPSDPRVRLPRRRRHRRSSRSSSWCPGR